MVDEGEAAGEPTFGKVVEFRSSDGVVSLAVCVEYGTVWLTAEQIAELFFTTPRNVRLHIKNGTESGEIKQDWMRKENFPINGDSSRSYATSIYNLRVILLVGMKVNSARGVEFRKWAGETLEHKMVGRASGVAALSLQQVEQIASAVRSAMLPELERQAALIREHTKAMQAVIGKLDGLLGFGRELAAKGPATRSAAISGDDRIPKSLRKTPSDVLAPHGT